MLLKNLRDFYQHKSLSDFEFNLDDARNEDILAREGKRYAYRHFPKRFHVLTWPMLIGIDYLDFHDGLAWVKDEHALRWRDVTIFVPQDLIICARVALESFERSIMSSNTDCKENFGMTYVALDWPVHLPIYNNRLWHFYNTESLADTHMHYIAGADTVTPSWISLMNKPYGREQDLDWSKFGLVNLDGQPVYNQGFNSLPWSKLFVVAALLRLYFTARLGIIEDSIPWVEDKTDAAAKISTQALAFVERIVHMQSDEYDDYVIRQWLDSAIGLVGDQKALLIYKKDSIERPIDYLLNSDVFFKDTKVQSRPGEEWLAMGERKLWIKAFHQLYAGCKVMSSDADLFLSYLQIYTKFRAELVLSNRKVGFDNFFDYQDRKEALLSTQPWMQQIRKGLWLNSRLSGSHPQIPAVDIQNVRIAPKPKEFNKAMDVFKLDLDAARCLTIGKSQVGAQIKHHILKKLQVVVHFIKMKDSLSYINELIEVSPRHYSSRRRVKLEAGAVARWINSGVHEKRLVKLRGIDAASNELHTRPEVYAQAYRFLKGIRREPYENEGSVTNLKLFAHAGEEFYGLVDGLRYIHETMLFQKLSSGDAIGHALALGIDPDHFYKAKHYRISVTKQDFLDNVAWLLNVVPEWGINLSYSYAEVLKSEFIKVFQQVYKLDTDDKVPHHSTYFEAWKLRGDDPKYYYEYKNEPYENIKIFAGPNDFEYYGLNDLINDEKEIRKNKEVRHLYHRYHFDLQARKAGNELKNVKIVPELISVVKAIQVKMSEMINHKGIVIETLPATNLLISTINWYRDHPLLRFSPITINEKTERAYMQLTSVGTDNPGVCNISLENQYSLLYATYLKEKLGNEVELTNWIRNLIEQSRAQVWQFERR